MSKDRFAINPCSKCGTNQVYWSIKNSAWYCSNCRHFISERLYVTGELSFPILINNTMNEQLKKQAEKIFREKFNEIDYGKSIEDWIFYNEVIYNKVIIPSIVQALEIGKVEGMLSTMNEDINDPFPEEGIDLSKPTPKIQPGQKLKHGDYFEGGTEEQYKELLDLEGDLNKDFYKYFIEDCINGCIVYIDEFGRGTLDNLTCYKKTKYEFEDFRILCDNTFGDGK